MQVVQAPDEGTILVIAAHPDDMEAFCAGTVGLAIEAGCRAELLLTTPGNKGAQDPATDPEELAKTRIAEAREAAEYLGFSDVHVLDYGDGEVENTVELRRDLTRVIRQVRPRVVFTFDPDHSLPPYISHRDHRMTGRAALDCVFPIARDPLNFPEQYAEGLEPHKVQEVWLFASGVADCAVDISAMLDRKIQARILHRTQTANPEELPERWRERARRSGEAAGLDAAETFVVVKLGR